jgi:hypothetical protein
LPKQDARFEPQRHAELGILGCDRAFGERAGCCSLTVVRVLERAQSARHDHVRGIAFVKLLELFLCAVSLSAEQCAQSQHGAQRTRRYGIAFFGGQRRQRCTRSVLARTQAAPGRWILARGLG